MGGVFIRQVFVALLVLVGLGAGRPVMASSELETRFEKANELFGEGAYADAAAAYDALEKMGVDSAVLYYNRGNAEARLGNAGRAVLYYERALARDPYHQNARYNMNAVRDFVARRANRQGRDVDLAMATGPWEVLVERFSDNGAAVLLLVVYVLGIGLILLRPWFRSEWMRAGLAVATSVCLLLSLFMGAVVLTRRARYLMPSAAVIVAEEESVGTVFELPGSKKARFGIEEGARVRIVGSRDGWVKIVDARGRDGWISRANVGII